MPRIQSQSSEQSEVSLGGIGRSDHTNFNARCILGYTHNSYLGLIDSATYCTHLSHFISIQLCSS